MNQKYFTSVIGGSLLFATLLTGVVASNYPGVPCIQGQNCFVQNLNVNGVINGNGAPITPAQLGNSPGVNGLLCDGGFCIATGFAGTSVAIVTDPRFGAKCNGVATATTDTNGIKAAVTFLAGTGQLVIPPTGHPCLINAEIDLPTGNSIHVIGPGMNSSTYLQASSLATNKDIIYMGANTIGAGVKDLKIDCTSLAGGLGAAIEDQFSKYIEIRNVFTTNCDRGVNLNSSQEPYLSNVKANLDGIGLSINATGYGQYLGILSQNSQTINIDCNGCGNSIFDIPLQDEGGATNGVNERFHNATDNTIRYGGLFFGDAVNGVGLLIDGASTGNKFKGAHMQQYNSVEAPPWKYAIYVDAGSNNTFEDFIIDGNTSFCGLPDAGCSAPPSVAPIFVASGATINKRNVTYINSPDGGFIVPWDNEGLQFDAGLVLSRGVPLSGVTSTNASVAPAAGAFPIWQCGADAGVSGAATIVFPTAFSAAPYFCACVDVNATVASIKGCGIKAEPTTSQVTFETNNGSDEIMGCCLGPK